MFLHSCRTNCSELSVTNLELLVASVRTMCPSIRVALGLEEELAQGVQLRQLLFLHA